MTSTAVTPSVLASATSPSTAAPHPYTGRLTLSSCAKRRRLAPRACFTKSPDGRAAGRFSASRRSYACGSAVYDGVRENDGGGGT